MKISMRLVLSVVVLGLFCRQETSAQLSRTTTKVGTTAAQFLKIGAGARSVGMGGAAVAMPGDVYSIYWNPGALSRISNSGEATFTHAAWLADVNYDFAAGALTVDGLGVIGLSVTSLRTPQDIVRTEMNPDGDGRVWDASDFSMGLTFARSLTDRFSIGITAKYIRQTIWNESASGMAFDVGTIYTTPFNDLKIGASISNFGTKMRLDGSDLSFNSVPGGLSGQGPQNVVSQYTTDSYDIPLTFRIGLSMDVLKFNSIRATAAVDATHPNDNTEYINSGLEVAYDEMIFGRVGYKSLFMMDSESSLTWGFGVNFNLSTNASIKVDYAFADYNRLKNVQYLTVSVGY
jgi:opacity protein-like surface antigen